MSRELPEWIADHDDQAIPPRVRLRVFERHGGVCHISGRKIMPGDQWDCDHVVALINGGSHRESNLAPALRDKHREKTAEDVAIKSKVARVRAKHLGITANKRHGLNAHPTLVRGFDGQVRERTSRGFRRREG